MAFRGLPTCACLEKWLPVFERMIGRSPRLFQLVGNAPASAGFHKDGGSADYEPLTTNELRIARNMGAAAWNRLWKNNYHSHLRLNGCPHNTIAQPQVEDLNEGRDGTGPLYDNAGKPDDGPRNNVKFPLRTWREGIEWAERKMEDDEMTPEEKKQLTRIEKKLDKIIELDSKRDKANQARAALNKREHDETQELLKEEGES